MCQAMMHTIFALLVVTSGLVTVRSYRILSVDIPHLYRCTRFQDHLTQCVNSSIKSMRPYLLTGIPRLNISSFEPYMADTYELRGFEKFNGSATFTNTRIHGITNYIITNVLPIVLGADNIKFHARFPFLKIFTTYSVNATVDNTSVAQSGIQAMANITNLRTEIELDGEFYRDMAYEEYFRLDYVSVYLEVGRYKVKVKPPKGSKYSKSFLKNSLKQLARRMKHTFQVIIG